MGWKKTPTKRFMFDHIPLWLINLIRSFALISVLYPLWTGWSHLAQPDSTGRGMPVEALRVEVEQLQRTEGDGICRFYRWRINICRCLPSFFGLANLTNFNQRTWSKMGISMINGYHWELMYESSELIEFPRLGPQKSTIGCFGAPKGPLAVQKPRAGKQPSSPEAEASQVRTACNPLVHWDYVWAILSTRSGWTSTHTIGW